jgi:cytochrome P450
MPSREPTVAFDHHSAEVAADPAQAYAALRTTTPVFWSESYGGYWVFTKYDHLAEMLTHPDQFSSARRDDAGGPGSSVSIPKRPSREQYPLELDPPRSTAYRRILNPRGCGRASATASTGASTSSLSAVPAIWWPS